MGKMFFVVIPFLKTLVALDIKLPPDKEELGYKFIFEVFE